VADVTLRVNGREYAGWKTARIVRGIEACAGTFELSVSDRWDGQDAPWPIAEEDECTVFIGAERVISGWVDRRRVSYGPDEHTLEVRGRDRTGALVDCSAVLKSWEFTSIPLLTLAQRLAEPFGISVRLDATVTKAVSLKTGKTAGSVSAGGTGKLSGLGVPKPPKKFSVDPGESAFQVLDRACRMAGVLPVSDGAGGLVLVRAGSTRADIPLVEGQNILAASGDFDATARYARYIVSAQQQGTDEEWGEAAASVTAEARDPNVRRSDRVVLIRADGGATPESARVRAAWEAKVRAARGDDVSVTVQGWQQPSGKLWPVNALVRVQSPRIGVDGDMLITQVEYATGDTGSTSKLTLRRPDAFTPEPVVSSTGAWKELAGGA
jgi:prophage tail gpP-like protein